MWQDKSANPQVTQGGTEPDECSDLVLTKEMLRIAKERLMKGYEEWRPEGAQG